MKIAIGPTTTRLALLGLLAAFIALATGCAHRRAWVPAHRGPRGKMVPGHWR